MLNANLQGDASFRVNHQGFTLEIGKYREISLCHIRGHFMENPCGLQAPLLCGPHQEECDIGVSLHSSGVFFPFPETTTCMHVIPCIFILRNGISPLIFQKDPFTDSKSACRPLLRFLWQCGGRRCSRALGMKSLLGSGAECLYNAVRIYSHAEFCIVWLSPALRGSACLMHVFS